MADLTTYNGVYGRFWLASHQPHLNWRNNDVRFRHRGRSVYMNAPADFGEDDVILSQISDSIDAMEANCLIREEKGNFFVVLVLEGTFSSVPKRQVRKASNDERIHQLFEQYKDKLFTDELPPDLPVSRGEFDHKIKLVDDRKTSVGYTVRLSTLEQDQLKVMIDTC